MANVATLTAKMVMDLSGFSSGANKAIGYLGQLKGGVGSLAASMAAGAVGGLAMAGGMAVLNAGMSALTTTANAAKDALMWGAQLAADQEQAQVAFTTMLHSGEAATEMLRDLEKFATATPFDFPQVRNSAKSLLAMGIAAKDIKPSLQTLGEIASGVGAPLEQLALVFGQVKTAGRLMTQDMNQFTSAGVALPRALAKELGIADTQVRKFVETGKVSFQIFQNALIRLAETDFAGGMENQSRTALGALSTLNDQAGGLFKDLAGGIGEKFKTTEWINDLAGFLGYVREKWGPSLINVFVALGKSLEKALAPLRIGLASIMRSMATLETIRGNMVKGTDLFSSRKGRGDDGAASNAALLRIAANQISGNTIGESAAQLQKFFKDHSIMPEGSGGLKNKLTFTEMGSAIGGALSHALGLVAGTDGASLLGGIGGRVGGGLGRAGTRISDAFSPDFKNKDPGPTGALVAGSSEAFSAIIRAMTGRDREATAKASLAELKAISGAATKTVESLGKIAEKLTSGVIASFSGG